MLQLIINSVVTLTTAEPIDPGVAEDIIVPIAYCFNAGINTELPLLDFLDLVQSTHCDFVDTHDTEYNAYKI